MNKDLWSQKVNYAAMIAALILFIVGCELHAAENASDVPASNSENIEESEDANREPSMAKKAPVLALSREAINEIEIRQAQLQEQEKILQEREESIKIQEKILSEKMKRIELISEKMAERLDSFKQRSQEKIGKLVSVVEGMKPDAAAKFFESVDPNLAVEVLTRIDTQRASKILNKVDKERSARLSELYTGYRSKIEKEKAERTPAS